MRAFITGITGFVGSHLAEYLLESNWEVVGSSCDGHWRFPVHGRLSRVPVYRWDLRTDPSVDFARNVIEFQPTHIFHLGGVSVPADCGDREPTSNAWATNVEGTQRVIELCTFLPNPRFLLSSSCHVYGPVNLENRVVSETAISNPQSGYALTKMAAEELVSAATAKQVIQGVIARGFQHTGPRQSNRMMLPEWVLQIVQKRDPVLVRALDTYLDLMDVRDTVRDYVTLATIGKVSEVYNVGTGKTTIGRNLMESIRHLLPGNYDVKELLPGIRVNPIADMTKLNSLRPVPHLIEIATTIRDTYEFWRTTSS